MNNTIIPFLEKIGNSHAPYTKGVTPSFRERKDWESSV